MNRLGEIVVDMRNYCPALAEHRKMLVGKPVRVTFDPEKVRRARTPCKLSWGFPRVDIGETSPTNGKYGELVLRCQGCDQQRKGFVVLLKGQKIRR